MLFSSVKPLPVYLIQMRIAINILAIDWIHSYVRDCLTCLISVIKIRIFLAKLIRMSYGTQLC